MQFAGEHEKEQRIQRELGPLIEFAERCLNSWLTIDHRPKEPIDLDLTRATFSLDAKICRQFRSILGLCKRGESQDAGVLTRTLFESYLAIEFVSRKRISLKYYGKKKINGRTILPPRSLPREMRARLFLAHFAIAGRRLRSQHGNKPGVKRHARRLASQPPQAYIDRLAIVLGPDWMDRLLARPRTYSGLNVAELAESLGKVPFRWYSTIYSMQSDAVHISDAAAAVMLEGKEVWHDSLGDVELSLRPAINLFLAGIGALHTNLCLGSSVGMLTHGLEKECARIRPKWDKAEPRE